ncbi:hypothetical protein LTR36_001076 [Oleoguttula mirabilis]|uniref:Dihydrolipoamide acetyltransferase component of pyruvate dehydrogenase complex n=1 Tax=Oleoguttula mirabilis TaxID=1507867 RepID=A0AAV9JQ12_9PEZI|nr:hypothetical protein LTR36_001076 [Oleoguttula mirabilis]
MSVSKSALVRALHYTSVATRPRNTCLPRSLSYRQLHATSRLDVVKPFLLADIGEGITECQLIQWFVQPGARVEQFDKLCEVQSDKASVEITSPFDGVIKKLHYEPDDMAITGKPLVDIDIQSEISDEDAEKLGGTNGKQGPADESVAGYAVQAGGGSEEIAAEPETAARGTPEQAQQHRPRHSREDKGSLATPAVRHLIKELDVSITDVQGTGRDGRVLKEDVHRHVSQQTQEPVSREPTGAAVREDRKAPLTPVQMQMFKTMTRSLNIPHFLYTCAADMGAITTLRKKLNAAATSPEQKLTHLPFILKAVSLALQHHPLVNSSLDTRDPKKPALTYRGTHNFGIAIDAPSGLLVPVVHNVQDLSIAEIAVQLRQLSDKARNNKLAPSDFSGATFTISNIGSVGGGVVAPVITEPQVAILGVGRSKLVPAFDENEELVKKEELVLSWSADHRIVDGAECGRCAERVRALLEEPGRMMVEMR